MKPGAHDPLRARLPRGFAAARRDSAPRLVWAWPIGIALVCVLAVVGFAGWRLIASRARGTHLPVHPQSGQRAVLALWSERGYGPRREAEEGSPVVLAAWSDGSLIWSERASDSGGRPYRSSRLAPGAVRELVNRVRAALDFLPEDQRSFTVLDSGFFELRIEDDEGTSALRWSPALAPGPESAAGRVRNEIRAALLSTIPPQGELLPIEGLNFERSR